MVHIKNKEHREGSHTLKRFLQKRQLLKIRVHNLSMPFHEIEMPLLVESPSVTEVAVAVKVTPTSTSLTVAAAPGETEAAVTVARGQQQMGNSKKAKQKNRRRRKRTKIRRKKTKTLYKRNGTSRVQGFWK